MEYIEAQLRQTLAGVVWTHKIQEKQADNYLNRYNLFETIRIVILAITTSGIVSCIFVDEVWIKIVTAILSAISLFISTYLKSYDFKGLHQRHKETAIQFEEEHMYTVGSVGRGTAIKNTSDLDILFDLPKEVYTKYDNYESNGQSALLQEVKNVLLERYPNTKMKGDGQVVVISFTKYKVELVPGFKQIDDRFKYPNSNDGGSWKYTNPLPEIEECKNSNDSTDGNFYNVCHMLRAWKNKKGFKFKGLLIDTLTDNFFNENEKYKNVNYEDYLELIKNIFKFLKNEDATKSYWLAIGSNQQIYNDDNGKFVKKAEKAYNKLVNKKEEDDDINEVLRGIFGREFPKKQKETKNLFEETIQYKDTEEFIEDKYIVDIQYNLELDCTVTQDGYRPAKLSEMLRERVFLKPRKQLQFYIKNINEFENLKPYNICWKVKNEGEVAKKRNMVRGQIYQTDITTQEEHTDFRGNHYVEAYIVKDDVCIAKGQIDVPIREMIEN